MSLTRLYQRKMLGSALPKEPIEGVNKPLLCSKTMFCTLEDSEGLKLTAMESSIRGLNKGFQRSVSSLSTQTRISRCQESIFLPGVVPFYFATGGSLLH